MPSATIFEAKTNLSKLIQRALKGEDVQITTGRERKPVVRLVAIEPVPRQPPPRISRGAGRCRSGILRTTA